ncbi:MAG: hypothetical protein AAGE98_09505 [Actinomycetota bacterium]
MGTILAQMFVALGVSLVAGFALGFTFGIGRRRADDPTTSESVELAEVVEREAGLIEALARADADRLAHSAELADANEEIICLLEQLHEARSPSPETSAPS